MMSDAVQTITNDRSEADVVWGAEQIARLLGLSKRQIYHLVDTGRLPIGKLGGRLFAKRSTLSAFLDRLSAHDAGGEA